MDMNNANMMLSFLLFLPMFFFYHITHNRIGIIHILDRHNNQKDEEIIDEESNLNMIMCIDCCGKKNNKRIINCANRSFLKYYEMINQINYNTIYLDISVMTKAAFKYSFIYSGITKPSVVLKDMFEDTNDDLFRLMWWHSNKIRIN